MSKINDLESKGDINKDLSNFFKSIGEFVGEFEAKVTGICIVYANYCIHLLESSDPIFLDIVLNEV